MWFVVMGPLLLIAGLFTAQLQDRGDFRDPGIDAMAGNFLVYKNAVLTYWDRNGGSSTIPDSALSLPPGYQKLSPWSNTINGEKLIVYGLPRDGQATDVARRARDLADGAAQIGVVQGGHLVTPESASLSTSFSGYADGTLVNISQRCGCH